MSIDPPYYALYEGEALVSFLRRLTTEFGITSRSVADRYGSFPDRRSIDRNIGDFQALGVWLETDPLALQRASESWVTTGMDGKSWLHECPARAFERAYNVYCPECLAESCHWRFAWLFPHAFICRKHGLLLLRSCSTCLIENVIKPPYSRIEYDCPNCGKPLSEGVRVRADQSVVYAADAVDVAFGEFHNAATDSAYARDVLIAWWFIVRKLNVEDVLARSPRWTSAVKKFSTIEIPDFGMVIDQRPYLFAWRFAIIARVACTLAPACVGYLQGRNPIYREQQFRYFLDHWSTEVIKGKWEAPAAS